MSIYYSAKNNGFYDTGVHGEPLLMIPDDSYDGDGEAPLISVANPLCKIPSDAKEITLELHTELLRGQGAGGKVIMPDPAGQPVLGVPTPKVLTDDEKITAYRAAVGRHIDEKAQSFGFDSILTAVTYADEPAGPLDQAYGQALREWRSLCWDNCRNQLKTWMDGGDEPDPSSVINALPQLILPDHIIKARQDARDGIIE